MNLTPHSPFSSKASQLLSWGHWFTFANIGLVMLISLVYLAADKAPSTLVGWFYMLITWLSHTSFITFCAFVLTIFPLSLVFPYPRHIRGMAAVTATTGIIILMIDAFVYLRLGYHINPASLSDIIALLWQTIVGSSWFNVVIALTIIVAVLTFELLAGNYAWRHLAELKSLKFPRYATGTIVTCFALSHSLHIWADANAFFDITKQDNVLPLSYPTTAKTLLARHDLLDLERYEQARSLELSDKQSTYQPPLVTASCKVTETPAVTIYLFTDAKSYQALLSDMTESQHAIKLESVLRAGNSSDAEFSLIYGLPSYYKDSIVLQQQAPVWALVTDMLSAENTSYPFIANDPKAPIKIKTVAELSAADTKQPFVALDISDNSTTVVTTTALTNIAQFNKVSGLVQPNDIMYTLLSSYFGCRDIAKQSMLASDVTTRPHAEGVNFTQGVLVAYKKDKITLVNQDGSFKQMSAKEGFVLDGNLDVPFLIQSIKTLKKYSTPPEQ